MRYRHRWPKGTWMLLQSAATLRALMDQRDMSQGRLARYAGCSRVFIGFLLTGKRRTCTPELATNIAEALDVPLEILFIPKVTTASGQFDRRSSAS